MPNIKVYQQQTSTPAGFDQTQANPDVFGMQGKMLQKAGQAVGDFGDAVEYAQTVAETSKFAEQQAQFRLKQTQKLKEDTVTGAASVDGYADKFMQETKDGLDKLSENLNTAKAVQYARRSNADALESLGTHAISVAAEMKSVQIKETHENKMNSYTQEIQQNPAAYENIKKALDEELNQYGFHPKMLEKQKNEDYRRLAMAYQEARISQAGRNELPSMLNMLKNSGVTIPDLSGEDRQKLVKYAQFEIDSRDRQAEHDLVMQEHALKRMAESTMNDAYIKLIETGEMGPKDVKNVKMQNGQPLPWEYKERLLGLVGMHEKKMTNATDGPYTAQAYKAIMDGSMSPKQLEEYYTGGLIKKESFTWLSKMYDWKKTPLFNQYKTQWENFDKAAKTALTKTSMGLPDPDGDKVYADVISQAQQKAKNLLEGGMSPSEVFDTSGDSYKKGISVYYLIDSSRRSIQQKMDSTIKILNQNNNEAPKFKSIEEYEKAGK